MVKLAKTGIRTVDARSVKPAPKVKATIYYHPDYAGWRTAVLERGGWRCVTCGQTEGRLYPDHIVEISDGGEPFDVANGQVLCASCHTKKTYAARAARRFS
jgi:5-methylcytosine-specific restriction endonuclease McrA